MAFNEQSGLSVDGVVHNTMNESVDGIKTFLQDPIIPDEVYGSDWNGKLEPPTKNAVYDKMETKADDSAVVHDTGDETIAGVKTFSSAPIIPADAFGSGWNGKQEPAPKDAVYDKITAVEATISGFATDSAVVHDTGDETIAGVKTFSSAPVIPDEVYGSGWNGKLEPPTKNAVYDKMETMAVDSAVVHLAGTENITGAKTFTLDVIVPAEIYGVGWNGSNEVPTKNDIYDKIETLATDTLVVHLAGTETITGAKTFSSDVIVPDEIYGVGWNGSMEVPTKNAIYDKIETLAADTLVVHLAGTETITGAKTFSQDVIVPDEAYGVSWNGSLEVPTKNAIYDQIETVAASIAGLAQDSDVVHLTGDESIDGEKTFTTAPLIADEAYGGGWSGKLSPPTKNAVYNQLEAMAANLPIAVYKAVLDQTGTSAPTEEEAQKSSLTGGTPSFGRPSGAGTYTVTSINSFPVGKTHIQVSTSGKHASIDYEHTSASVITLTAKTASDEVGLADLGGKISLSIEVYA